MNSAPSEALADGHILYQSGAIAQVVLNRPERANACTPAMWRALAELWPKINQDKKCRAVLLRGQGKHFCSGADMADFADIYASEKSRADFTAIFRGAIDGVAAIDVPVIAQISGAVIGGGLCLALAADFRLADETAFFAVTAANYGFTLHPLDSQRLIAIAGLHQAKRMLYLAENTAATEAEAAKLIDGLYNHEVLAEKAEQLCKNLLALNRHSHSASKAILRGLTELDFPTELAAIYDKGFAHL